MMWLPVMAIRHGGGRRSCESKEQRGHGNYIYKKERYAHHFTVHTIKQMDLGKSSSR
jgi:hypothetical protein